MKPKISLIMPVYNAESFIKKALLSIKAQNFTSLELVIVNDGTPDNSMKIVEDFFLENPICHIIINQVNQGRTKARNIGLETSQGDYVMFMDSDDFLEPDMINQMYQQIINEDAQLAYCGYRRVNFSGETIMRYQDMGFRYIPTSSGKDMLIHALEDKTWIATFCTLMKKDLLTNNNIKFIKNRVYGEDQHFTYRTLYYAQRVASVEYDFYNYVQHPRSTMQAVDIRHFQTVAMLLSLRYHWRCESDNELLLDTLKKCKLPTYTLTEVYALLAAGYDKKKMVSILKNSKIRGILKNAKKPAPIYIRISAKMALFTPRFYCGIMSRLKVDSAFKIAGYIKNSFR